ncbi:MAG: hypothetical protein QOF48_356 [Verrucomicrobiota bacterium]
MLTKLARLYRAGELSAIHDRQEVEMVPDGGAWGLPKSYESVLTRKN